MARRDLFEEISEEGRTWQIDFHARAHDGREIWIGKGNVVLDEQGIPKSYPEFTIDSTMTHEGTDHAVHIYDDIESSPGATPLGKGKRHPATAHAIGRMLALYERRFGHKPDALQDILAWSNKHNVQREFHRLAAVEGLGNDQAAVTAIKNISFGKHRMTFGYDRFDVSVSGTELVDLGPPYGNQRVPRRIFVVARRST